MTEAQAQVVYTNLASSASVSGSLFTGKKFWIAQRTPSRTHYADLVRSNGGDITQLEKQADYLICDHLRQDIPPGGISYKFIEQSVRDGRIADPDEHICAPPKGAARAVGSSKPVSRVRKTYTAEEDRLLYKWVKDAEARNVAILGNELYKQLEQYNTSHPWQSWRDRYIKQLQYKPPIGWDAVVIVDRDVSAGSLLAHRQQPNQGAPHQPPARQNSTDGRASTPASTVAENSLSERQALKPRPPADRQLSGQEPSAAIPDGPDFLAKDFFELFENADGIAAVPYEKFLHGFQSWAKDQGRHTADEWQEFFTVNVLPFHRRLLGVEHRWMAVHDAMEEWLEEHPAGSIKEWSKHYKNNVKPNFATLEAVIAAKKDEEQSVAVDENSQEENVEAGRSAKESDNPREDDAGPSPGSRKRELEDSTLPDKSKRQCIESAIESTVIETVENVSVDVQHETIEADADLSFAALVELQEASEDESEEELKGEPAEEPEEDRELRPEKGPREEPEAGSEDESEENPEEDFEETTASSDGEDSQPTGARLDWLATTQLRDEMIQQEMPPSSPPARIQEKLKETQYDSIPVLGDAQLSSQSGESESDSSPNDQEPDLAKCAVLAAETQAILSAPTQDVDLELAEPDGGFAQSSPTSNNHTQTDDVDSLADMDLDLAEPDEGFEIIDGMMIDAVEDESAGALGEAVVAEVLEIDKGQVAQDAAGVIDQVAQEEVGVVHDNLANQRFEKLDRDLAEEQEDMNAGEKTAEQSEDGYTQILLPLETQEDSVLGKIPRQDDALKNSDDEDDDEDDDSARLMRDKRNREIAETPQPDDQLEENSSWVHVNNPQEQLQEEASVERVLYREHEAHSEEGRGQSPDEVESLETVVMISGALRQLSPDIGAPKVASDTEQSDEEGSKLPSHGIERAITRSPSSSMSKSITLTEAEDDVAGNDVAASQPPVASKDIPSPVVALQRQGFELQQITVALYSTSGNGELSAKVAEQLRSGRAVPDDEPGVWTESDDENLRRAERDGVLEKEIALKGSPKVKRRESGPLIKLRMLRAKHGRSGLLERRKFLQSIGRL